MPSHFLLLVEQCSQRRGPTSCMKLRSSWPRGFRKCQVADSVVTDSGKANLELCVLCTGLGVRETGLFCDQRLGSCSTGRALIGIPLCKFAASIADSPRPISAAPATVNASSIHRQRKDQGVVQTKTKCNRNPDASANGFVKQVPPVRDVSLMDIR